MADRVSVNCRAANGQPAAEHTCTGCPCWCHHVRKPAGRLRALVEASRRERAQTSSPGQRGEALPGLDPGGAG